MVATLTTLLAWVVVVIVVERSSGPYKRPFGDLPAESQYRFGAVSILGGLVSGLCLNLLLARSTHTWIGGTVMAVFVAGLWATMALEVRRMLEERRA